MSFYEELKRRNVSKVAVLYIIAAWLLLQVTDVLSSLLTVPEWAGSFVIMLLLLGFFPVMIFTWVYEVTPEGLKKEKDIDRSKSITPDTGRKVNTLIVVLLVLAIAGLVADRLIPETGDLTPGVEELAAAVSDRSIAVLPFVNMSSDDEQEYFSDGLSEELLNLLAKIPELQVTSRSSAFSYKGKDIKLYDVSRELNVAHILEGSVRRSGDQVRITAQLIEARTDTHLWSETFDRKLDDVFAIQDEIAAAVVAQLKVTLLGEAPKVEAVDPEAYSLYLQARHWSRQFTPETMIKAVNLYQQALAIAPDYAAAWAGLGRTYVNQANTDQLSITDGRRLAREAADRAVLIDPEYAPAHAALGGIARDLDNDPVKAAQHIGRALALAPTDSDVLSLARGLAQSLGRTDEAIKLGEYLVARDPVDATSHFILGLSYSWAGRPDTAIASLRNALTLSPGRIGAHYFIGITLLVGGKPESALSAFGQETMDEEYRVKGTALALHDLGRQAEFEMAFLELRERWGAQWPSEIAHVYAWTGDADAAFEWLDKSVTQNEDGLSQQFLIPLYAPLHDDPRWLVFRKRSGTSEAQLAAIEFEVPIPN